MPTVKDKSRSNRSINRRIDRLANSISSIYKDTYKSRPDNKNNLERITSGIEDNLDVILDKINGQDVSDISRLYLRAINKSNSTSKQVAKSLEELFDSDGNILDAVNMNLIRKSIQSMDYQIDLICKYMPKLKDALEVKKDNVLSSDSFTKEFIETMSNKINTRSDYVSQFSDRARAIRDKYNFDELIEEIYWDTSKYGEYFLYHVPYRKGFKTLLDRREKNGRRNNIPNPGEFRISSNLESAREKKKKGIIWEAASDIAKSEFYDDKFKELATQGKFTGEVSIKFSDSDMIEELYEDYEKITNIRNSHQSIMEAYTLSLDKTGDGVLPLSEERIPNFNTDGLSPDGLNGGKSKNDSMESDKLRKDISGSIYYKIPRSQIIPIWISNTCVGYIYMKVKNDYFTNFTTYDSRRGTMLKNSMESDLMNDEWDRQNDIAVNQIASLISDQIDANFINCNLDLKEEIYSVLRYNDQFDISRGANNISCTFLPVEDVQHFYFKMDPVTHRGISDLNDALVPAMIWCMAYLNDSIARMSRGQDKRVYYVQQNVEKNVGKTMLNVISQLKKGNMGMRQLQNMNTMFNVVGKFNDYIIPIGPNGESPVRMEVMNGQDINTPTDLMDRMEEQAIFTTDVPPEFLQTLNQVDYASRFTMSNSRFLKKVSKRQSICQKQYSITFRKFYNYEYNENDTTISIRLPAPAYLAIMNNNQLFDNAKQQAQSVVELMDGADEADENVKNMFQKLYIKKYIGTYINIDEAQEMFDEAKMLVHSSKTSDMDDGDNVDDDEF